MSVKTKEKKQRRFRNFFQNREKKFWVFVFTFAIFVAIAGVGARILFFNATASSGQATVTKRSNSRTINGVTADTTYIRYGTDPDNGNRTWGTYRFNVTTSSGTFLGMCMQPNYNAPDNQTFNITTDIPAEDAIIIKEIMLVSVDGLDSTIQNAFNNANPNFWDNLSRGVQNFRTRDTSVGYASSFYYTPYFYNMEIPTGCKSGNDPECSIEHSTVPATDYRFALGHMMIGSYVNQLSAGLSVAETNFIEDGARAIVNWFNNNSTYKNRANNYTLYETVPPSIANQKIGWLEYAPEPDPTRIRIRKKSTTGEVLAGAKFRVNGTVYTTGSNGLTPWITLSSGGTVTYVETEAPSGYIGYTGNQTCTAVSETDIVCDAHPNEEIKAARVRIRKLISYSDDQVNCTNVVSCAGLSVSGTTFNIYDSGNNVVSTITIDDAGNGASSSSKPLDAGTYTIKENGVPTGIEKNATASLTFTLTASDLGAGPSYPIVDLRPDSDSTSCSAGSNQKCVFKNGLSKGKITFTKTGYDLAADGDMRPLKDIYFEVTNQADNSIKYTIGPTGEDGTVSGSSVPNMIFGDYKAVELRRAGSNNNAYKLMQFAFTISSTNTNTNSNSISIENNTGTGNGTTLRDDIPDRPNIETFARNSNSSYENPDGEIEISSDARVTDRITCSGLEANAEYRLRGYLWYIGVNPAVHVMTTPTSTGSENYVRSNTVFTADGDGKCKDSAGNLYIEMNFPGFDSSPYMGEDLAIKQILEKNNGTHDNPDWVRIAVHNNNLTDDKEKVTVKTITITSLATSGRQKNNKQLAAGDVKIIDSIEIIGLVNGTTYKIVAEVKDPSGNLVTIKDINGNSGTSITEEYTMASATGSAVTLGMDIFLDSTPYVGKDLKVVLTLKLANDSTIVTHNPNDDTETVSVINPEIGTCAANASAQGTCTIGADNTSIQQLEVGVIDNEHGSPTIRDTVSYNGLAVGSTFMVIGEVHKLNSDGTAGAAILSTNGPTGQSFTASAESGTVTLNFPIDTVTNCAVNNKLELPCKFVVYEYVYFGGSSTPFAKHENPADQNQILTVKDPAISTAATDIQNDTKLLPVGTTTVIDRVTYENLQPGQQFRLEGRLIDLSTNSVVVNGAGEEITATETFTASPTGTATIPVDSFRKFDTVLHYDYTLGANQKKYVVYQTLYSDNIELKSHAENNDEEQQVQIGVPSIHTTATYKADGSRILGVGDVTLVDIVEYEGLVEGEWYMISGTVTDPETGSPIEINDEFIRNTKAFKAGAKGRGTVNLEINLNTIPFQGKKFVVHERLYRSEEKHGDGRLLAVHEPAVDEDEQTISVKVVSIGTTAVDKADGNEVIDHEPNQTILDTIHYDGLLMGEDYIMYGYLYDKTNNQPLRDENGNLITATANFTTPNKKDSGDIEMEFNVNAQDLPGVEIVVYEYLFAGTTVPIKDDGTVDLDQAVTSHPKKEDEDQFPKSQTVKVSMRIGTTAADVYDGDQLVNVGNVGIIDKVKYEGATTGKTYKAKGWLVYKTDGDGHKAGDIVMAPKITCVTDDNPETDDDDTDTQGDDTETDGNPDTGDTDTDPTPSPSCTRDWEEVSGEVTFTIGEEGYEETTGFVTIIFEFDSRELIGKQVVVFEDLYLIDDEGNEDLVADHKNLEDEAQTITVDTPTVHTIATDKLDNDKELADDAEVIVVDTVEYSGLVPGDTYTLYGILVDKDTGERVSGGITEVTWTFTPERSSGIEEIEFTIDTTGMSGRELVVFETLYIGREPNDKDEIAKHQDLNDDSQTVWVKVKKPDTGRFTHQLDAAKKASLYTTIGAVTVIVIGGWVAYRFAKHRNMRKF